MTNLPCACSKKRLYLELKERGLIKKDIKESVYKVLQKNRDNCDLEKAKSIRGLFKNEVREVMEDLGELEPLDHSLSSVA